MGTTCGSQAEALRATGRAAIASGVSIIPINRRTKRPYSRLLPLLYDDLGQPIIAERLDEATGEVERYHKRGWKPFQSRIATPDELNCWIDAGAQLAVVCGAVSGGLLVIDFDVDGFYESWCDRCRSENLYVGLLTHQRTGGGGHQVFVCCDRPGENTKLAWAQDISQPRGRTVAIETRGEGGYAVIAPSLHPSGNAYTWLTGDIAELQEAEQHEVDAILDIARALSEVSEEPRPYMAQAVRKALPDIDRVIDRYNATADIQGVLGQFGYTPAYNGRWHRPGHDRHSEPSVVFKDNRSFHHSSNDQLSDGYWKTPFAVRLHYEFDGNVPAAVRAIAGELGMTRPQNVVARAAWQARQERKTMWATTCRTAYAAVGVKR